MFPLPLSLSTVGSPCFRLWSALVCACLVGIRSDLRAAGPEAFEFVLPDIEWRDDVSSDNQKTTKDEAKEDSSGFEARSRARAASTSDGSSRTIVHGLGVRSNVRVLESSSVGQPSTLLGTRRAAEEVDIQGLGGVSLSPPQGGGFDFSQYPRLLWDRLDFQESMVVEGVRDSKSLSATAQLSTWSEKVLNSPVQQASSEASSGRTYSAHRYASNPRDPSQYDGVLGVGAPGVWAGQVAWSLGASQGLGAVWLGKVRPEHGFTDELEGRLLISQVSGKDIGSRTYPTPLTSRKTESAIPVLRWSPRGTKKLRLELHSVWNQITYDSPEFATFSEDSSLQLAANAGLPVTQRLSLNLGWRRAQLNQRSIGESSPLEHQLTAAAVWVRNPGEADSLRLSGDGIWTQLLGFHPSAAIAQSVSWGEARAWVLEGEFGYQSRFPSLLDRYYVLPGFYSGNSSLTPERGARVSLGTNYRAGQVGTGLKGTFEYRRNAIVRAGFESPENQGEALMRSIEWSTNWSLDSALLRFESALRWSSSEVGVARTPYPYLSEWQGGFGIHWGAPLNQAGDWSVTWEGTAQSSRPVSTRAELPAFLLMDASAHVLVFKAPRGEALEAVLRIENLANEAQVELIADYPLPGRTVSLWLRGALDF